MFKNLFFQTKALPELSSQLDAEIPRYPPFLKRLSAASPEDLQSTSPRHTAVRSLQSNGIAESFVKIMKRDYISLMSKPNGLTALKNLAEALEHYNEWHPRSALGYRSLRDVDSYK